MHDRAYLTGEPTCWCLLLEFEIYLGQALLLLKDPLLGTRLAKKGNVLKEDFDNLLVVLQAILRQSDLAVEDSWCSWTDRIGTLERKC